MTTLAARLVRAGFRMRRSNAWAKGSGEALTLAPSSVEHRQIVGAGVSVCSGHGRFSFRVSEWGTKVGFLALAHRRILFGFGTSL
jgi:hypothetical protein